MNQVAVGRVDFNNLESSLEGSHCRSPELIDDGLYSCLVQSPWSTVILQKSDGTRCQRLPSSHLLVQLFSTFPRHRTTGLSPGMRQLDGSDTSLPTDKTGDLLQFLHMGILIQSQIRRSDTALRRNRSGFLDDQCSTANCPATVMDQMPVTGITIHGTVLTHGRYSNPVP